MLPPTGARPGRENPYRWGLLVSLGALTGYALFIAIGEVRSELLLIAVALVLALGLDPLVVRLTRRGLSRPWAVAVVAFAGLLALVGFLAWMVPVLTDQASGFVHRLPEYERRLQSRNGALGRFNSQYHVLDHLRGAVSSSGGSWAGGVFGVGRIAISAAAGTVLLIVLSLYFLACLPALKRLCRRFAPARHRDRVQDLTDAVCARVGGYVLGNVFTSLIAGAGTLVWAFALGLPDPLLLAVAVAVLDLIPMIGSTIGGVFATLLGLTVSVPVALGTAAFYIAYRLLEDYLITPRIMGRTVQVSGLLTIVSLVIGGALLGVVGALLAIPVAATIKLLLDEIAFPRLDRAWPLEPQPAGAVAVAEQASVRREAAPAERPAARPRWAAGFAGSIALFGLGVLSGRRR